VVSNAISVGEEAQILWRACGGVPPIAIRKGREADIEKVSRLWLDMVRESSPPYLPNVERWKNITLRMMRHHENYHLFVAEEAQDVVGFLDFMTVPEPATGCAHAVGRHLYVKPERRNAGTAGNLLLHYDGWARKDGAVVLDPKWRGGKRRYGPVGIFFASRQEPCRSWPIR